ncbi:hypothetical protein [Paenibacillus hamazuiensis]|uniref:hypothetical protein n=1 Tax=Paenibacillus hamazuiensis TaxID=2936508 RepID=UPI00200BEB5B|nr:hypothetical protein [Paenibacillus hamazuiensis]
MKSVTKKITSLAMVALMCVPITAHAEGIGFVPKEGTINKSNIDVSLPPKFVKKIEISYDDPKYIGKLPDKFDYVDNSKTKIVPSSGSVFQARNELKVYAYPYNQIRIILNTDELLDKYAEKTYDVYLYSWGVIEGLYKVTYKPKQHTDPWGYPY